MYDSFRLPYHPLSSPVNKPAGQNCKEYVRIDQESWNLKKDGGARRTIELVLYKGELVDIKDEEFEGVKDANSDVCVPKVTEFCLP